MAGDFAAGRQALLEFKEATRESWEASEAGWTYAQCRDRWKNSKTPPTVDEAVVIIKPLLEVASSIRRTAKDAARALAKGWLFRGSKLEEPGMLIAESRNNAVRWDALQLIYERLSYGVEHQGDEIPANLMKWRNDALERRISRPLSKRGRPTVPFRSFTIQKAIRELMALGMKPTRNDEPSQSASACDAVARATGLSFYTVKRIWFKFRGQGGISGLEHIDVDEAEDYLLEEFDGSVPDTPTFFLVGRHFRGGRRPYSYLG